MRRETALARLSEHGAPAEAMVAFFERVGARAIALCHAWELRVTAPVATDERSVEQIVQWIAAQR